MDTFDASGARLMGDLRNDTRLVSLGRLGTSASDALDQLGGPRPALGKRWLVRDGKTITSL